MNDTTSDAEHDSLDAIEELITDFGIRCVISACLRSSGSDEFAKLAPNETLRVIQVLIHTIVHSKNSRLEAEIIALGAGVLLADHNTMTEVGKRHGLTRAAISKRVLKFCDEHKLPPSEFMRSKKNRATYALTNRPHL